jgi:hypothetical protein
MVLKASEDDDLLKGVSAARLVLLYRGSRDGFLVSDFHHKVNNKINNVLLIKDIFFI